MGCSASSLANHHYPGGDWTCPPNFPIPDDANFAHWADDTANYNDNSNNVCKYSPIDNAVPSMALIQEADHSFMGQSFAVYPTVSGSGTIDQAQTGLWWRTWGPWFWTYTYQEIDGKQTIYMRPTLMGMLGLYSETRIMRCDGGGDVWFFGEGSGWVSNRIRGTFGRWFGMQRESTFRVYQNGNIFGTALETFHGSQKSITFRTGTVNPDRLGSAVLTAPQANPPRDLWSLHTQEHVNYHQLPPAYVMNAATVLMAFRWITIRHERCIPSGHTTGNCNQGSPSPPPSFLAETSNASVAFFEDSGDEHAREEEKEGEEEVEANTDASDLEGQKV